MSIEHSPARNGAASSAARPRLLTDRETAEILNCSRATVWRRVGDGTLPKPLKIGGMTRFVDSEIYDRVAEAMARREVAA